MDGCVAAVVLSRLRAVASLGWSIAAGWGLAPSGFPLLVKELMEPSPNHRRIRHGPDQVARGRGADESRPRDQIVAYIRKQLLARDLTRLALLRLSDIRPLHLQDVVQQHAEGKLKDRRLRCGPDQMAQARSPSATRSLGS